MPVAPASMLCTKRSWPGTSTKPSCRPSPRSRVGEAEIDGDAARLLLLQAVGIDAGQRLHQRRLAVVDMARGADDHGSAPRQLRGNARGELAGATPASACSSQCAAPAARRIARHALAGEIGRAQHRLASASPSFAASLPPLGRQRRVARHAERVVMDVAQPRHGAGAALRCRLLAPTGAPRHSPAHSRRPELSSYSMSWASASPCSAAFPYQRAAAAWSCSTP